MKFKSGLILTTVLFLPGWYLLMVAMLVGNGKQNKNELDANIEHWAPFFHLSFPAKLLIALGLGILGIAAGLYTNRGNTKGQRRLRIAILVLGVLSVAMLTFPFM